MAFILLMTTLEMSVTSSVISALTLAWIWATASSPMNRAGTHLVALASIRDMVSTSRAASEGPLNTRFITRHSAARANRITVNSSRKNRRTIRPNRPLPFFFFFLPVSMGGA